VQKAGILERDVVAYAVKAALHIPEQLDQVIVRQLLDTRDTRAGLVDQQLHRCAPVLPVAPDQAAVRFPRDVIHLRFRSRGGSARHLSMQIFASYEAQLCFLPQLSLRAQCQQSG
jgi:hypothetical protein